MFFVVVNYWSYFANPSKSLAYNYIEQFFCWVKKENSIKSEVTLKRIINKR